MNVVALKSSVRTSCLHCPIRHRAVCSDCDDDELEELNQIKTYKAFGPGETIAWAGEPMSMVGSVVEGVATLSITLADGRRQMVGLLLPSDFLGRPGRNRSPYDVVAATETTFCMFKQAEFNRLARKNEKIQNRVLDMTMDELDAAREWMLLLGRKTARERIATLLVIMARRDAALNRSYAERSRQFPLYVSREAMADYLGLTVETVSRQISSMRREGLIDLPQNRMVNVPDLTLLVSEAGGGMETLAS